MSRSGLPEVISDDGTELRSCWPSRLGVQPVICCRISLYWIKRAPRGAGRGAANGSCGAAAPAQERRGGKISRPEPHAPPRASHLGQ